MQLKLSGHYSRGRNGSFQARLMSIRRSTYDGSSLVDVTSCRIGKSPPIMLTLSPRESMQAAAMLVASSLDCSEDDAKLILTTGATALADNGWFLSNEDKVPLDTVRTHLRETCADCCYFGGPCDQSIADFPVCDDWDNPNAIFEHDLA